MHLPETGTAMRYLQAVVFLAFLLAIGTFAVQNRDVITVNFLNWNLSQPVALLSVVVYVLGMLSGWTVVAFVRGSFRGATEKPRH
jgi:lipopolysaccharide assembly protein A